MLISRTAPEFTKSRHSWAVRIKHQTEGVSSEGPAAGILESQPAIQKAQSWRRLSAYVAFDVETCRACILLKQVVPKLQ